MNYSRFGAICELESAQEEAPQKPRCGATVCVQRKSICVRFKGQEKCFLKMCYYTRKSYKFVHIVCIDNVPRQCPELLYTHNLY